MVHFLRFLPHAGVLVYLFYSFFLIKKDKKFSSITLLPLVPIALTFIFQPEDEVSLLVFLIILLLPWGIWIKMRDKAALRHILVFYLLLIYLVFTPKFLMLFRIEHFSETFNGLFQLRNAVAQYYERTGKYPTALSEVGEIPTLDLWVNGERMEGEHWHAKTRGYVLTSTDCGTSDAGEWGYNPVTGDVFIACTGLDPKLGKPLNQY